MTRELPTGTVTMLFTDIEGSTRLLHELGTRYGELLRDHHELMVSAFEDNGGRLVDTQGDACFAVFSTASDGLRAAAGIQAALKAHSWPEGVDLAVRMGLHTGSPVLMDDRYVGMDVHRAARIAGVAHGGQIVVSAGLKQLVDIPELEWIWLGEYRLKGLERPEGLYQVSGLGLEERFPPPQAPLWTPALPEPSTTFLGRDGDVTAAIDLLAGESKLVTLLGPGGIGKTRLAVQVGHRCADVYRDGVVFVPLATVTDPDEIPRAIEDAIGHSDGGRDRPMEWVLDHLRDRDVLLILDNLEHLRSARGLVADLLGAGRGIHVLATSRAPLGLYGEKLYDVRPLSLPESGGVDGAKRADAVALFVDRAQAVSRSFRLSEANVEPVVEICRRLEGIPLAVELAASRIGLLSPAELVARLRLEILTSSSPDRDARQRTLRATIAWSHRLLDDQAGAVFRRLAVCPAGATVAAAEAVAGKDIGDVLTAIEELVSHSLLWREEPSEGTSRFRMLETVREFALEELERSSELIDTSDRHASHLVSLVEHANEGFDGPDAEGWFERIEQEAPNLRAALRWTLEDARGRSSLGVELANALGWFWYVRGDATEGRRWLELAVDADPDTPMEIRVRLVYYAAAMLERLGELDDSMARFETALGMFRRLGDEMRIGRTLNSLSSLAIDTGQTSRAVEYLEEARPMLEALEDAYGLAVNMINSSDVAVAAGDLGSGEESARAARELFEEMGNEWGVAVATRHLAKVAYAGGDLDEARSHLVQSLEGSHGVGDRSAVARCLERLAGVEIARGDTRRGARLGAASTVLRADLGEPLADHRRPSFESSWATARELLGDAEFDRCWLQGRHMTVDQAVEYACDTGDASLLG